MQNEEKTLRDEFAMAALQGYFASEHIEPEYQCEDGKFAANNIARIVYFMADAMLAERMK